MVSQSSLHRGSNPERAMDSAEIVMQEVKRDHVAVVLQLLAESVCQSRESAHPHAHRKILPFHERCADVLWVRIANHRFHVAADAGRRTVTGFVGRRSAVDFVQHRVINFRAERILDSL